MNPYFTFLHKDLVNKHLPHISAHLETIGLPLATITQPWFLCMFIGYVPLQVVLLLVDIKF